MPRACQACIHPKRRELDQALLDPAQTLRNVAKQFQIDHVCLFRHRRGHLVPELTLALEKKVEERVESLARYEIARKEARVASVNDRWRKLHQIAQERGEDMRDVPGGSTGLLTRTYKSVGSGDDAQVVEEYRVETGLLREMRAHEQAAAEELGQREIGGGHAAGGTIVIMVPTSIQTPSQAAPARIIDIVPGRWQDNPQAALPAPEQPGKNEEGES